MNAKEITEILVKLPSSPFFFRKQYAALPNVSWALLPWEADLLICSQAGYLTEVEIKVVFSDWKKDIEKNKWRTELMSNNFRRGRELIKRFFYAAPMDLARRHVEIEFPDHAGVLGVDDTGSDFWWNRYRVKQLRKPVINCGARAIDDKERWRMGRLATIKLWSGDLPSN